MNENSHTSKCPRCGATLAADAPDGLCPRCLVALNFATQTEIPDEEVGPGGTKVVKTPPLAPPSCAAIARHFPQLEILECLGRGGMGVVYKARQTKLNRLVALKILAPERERDAKFAGRFTREAQALARLSHPNIVAVYDFGEADGLFYLLMEFVDGMSLRQLMQSHRATPEQALAIVPKICEALQFAHQKGIVHRDIKPENILLDKDGQVKIADFGIAKLMVETAPTPAPSSETAASAVAAGGNEAANLTQDQVLGTPHYMAPEQVEKPQRVDHRADIYSLGVVFYEMLTGELPLGKFQPPSRKVQVDVRLDEVVLHALEKEPERRYQHASEVKSAVETIAATGAAPSTGTAPDATGPLAAPAVLQATKKRKGEFLGRGAAVQAIGLACLFVPPYGVVLGIVLLVIGGRMALKQICSHCGHHTTKDARICRVCGAHFTEAPHAPSTLRSWGKQPVKLGAAVGLLVFLLMAAVTFSLPKSYVASARVGIDAPGFKDASAADLVKLAHAERAFLLSPRVLSRLREQAGLVESWEKRFNRGGKLTDVELRALLAGALDTRVVQGVSFDHPEGIRRPVLLEIRFYDNSPVEAAETANALAEGYCQIRTNFQAELMDRAEPPLRHIKPNVALNLVGGTLLGLVLGCLVGGWMHWWAARTSSRTTDQSLPPPAAAPASKAVQVCRWTARVFSVLLLAFYGFFVLAEGLPPIASQPEGVQLNFAALGLMMLGFLIGWKREGWGALLIASGWTLWQISESRFGFNLFQTPLPVAALYAFCWWATRGRRTLAVVGAGAALAVALGLGRLLCPANVFIDGTATDVATSRPITNAEIRLLRSTVAASKARDFPNARSDKKGRFNLYVGWYSEAKQVSISALGYTTLTTNLGARGLGQRRLPRDFRLQSVAASPASQTGSFGPVIERVIRAASNDCWALNLASGNLVISTPEQPLDFRVGQADSLRSAKVDVYQPLEANTPDTVKVLEVRLVSLGAQAWDTSASEVIAHLEKEATVQIRRSEGFLNGSAVYAFSTREGASGMLQILKDSVPVKLRYKLVQPVELRSASEQIGLSPTPSLSPGSVSERVLDFDTERKTAYLDLDTGEYVDPGTNSTYGMKATPAGVDLRASSVESNFDVRWAINMALVPVESGRWEATAEEIRMAVGAVKREPEIRLRGGNSTNTWFFQTSEGGRGVLQFLPPKASDDPSQVRLRYRLAATNDARASFLQSASNLTDRDAEVQSVLVRGRVVSDKLDVDVRFAFQRPDQASLLLLDHADQTPLHWATTGRWLLYDPVQGAVLNIPTPEGGPSFRLALHDGQLEFEFGHSKGGNAKSSEQERVVLSLADFVGKAAGRPQFKSLDNGTVLFSGISPQGKQVRAWAKPGRKFGVQRLELQSDNGAGVFLEQIAVNEPIPAQAFALPAAEALGDRVKSESPNLSREAFLKLTAQWMDALTTRQAIRNPAQRAAVERQIGAPVDWAAVAKTDTAVSTILRDALKNLDAVPVGQSRSSASR
ncbi:MAG: protein kinase [Verrucomicrobia bacterium]|nr:protein kinase [Verrucomicrobiota bacterium]